MALSLGGILSSPSPAGVQPAGVFSDHMVLQRDALIPVWGTAAPGERITVQFADKTQNTVAAADGEWMIRLAAMPASASPAELTIKGADSSVLVKDVLVGDVWLCAGQSNMEMGVGECPFADDVAHAQFPGIRFCTVPREIGAQPQTTFPIPVEWMACSPQTLSVGAWGGFSAAAFFFGRELHRELNVPIGLMNLSWGGTAAEAWMSLDALRKIPKLKSTVERLEAQNADKKRYASLNSAQRDEWWQGNDPGSASTGTWAAEKLDDSDWNDVSLPTSFVKKVLVNWQGVVWFRKTIELPPGFEGKDLMLRLGPVDDCSAAFVNGVLAGETIQRLEDRSYRVPASVLRGGRNVIALRVLLDNVHGFGGPCGSPEQLRLSMYGHGDTPALSLAGLWRWKASAALGAMKPRPPGLPEGPYATSLYNGIISPIAPFAVRGAIWYQGESNTGNPGFYRALLPALIADWRSAFALPQLPFHIVQLANFGNPAAQPGESAWAQIREAQSKAASEVPNCGLAVAIDIGDAVDIHPKEKRELGRRLARTALAKTYGQPVSFSGPEYESMRIDGTRIRLKFKHIDGGLVTKGGPLKQFAVCGADGKFVWADASIEPGSPADEVIVSSAAVEKPVAVRYAWADNPEGCNLYNAAGFPASPFRTDRPADAP